MAGNLAEAQPYSELPDEQTLREGLRDLGLDLVLAAHCAPMGLGKGPAAGWECAAVARPPGVAITAAAAAAAAGDVQGGGGGGGRCEEGPRA